jgi:iron uptake system component EfeO
MTQLSNQSSNQTSNRKLRSLQIGVAIILTALTLGACSSPQTNSDKANSGKKETTAQSSKTEDSAKSVDLSKEIADYKAYVVAQVSELVNETKEFTAAVKAGDVKKAQSLYATTRKHYERIEPVAELFSDLDGAIDARADDFAQKEKDPTWTGFHRIEMTLFKESSTEGLTPLADQLVKDVNELKSKVAALDIPPKVLVGGTSELIEEMAAKKITGEENRYSGADLSDFQANLEGSKKIVDLLRPQVQKIDASLLARVDENFQKVDTAIAKYKTPEGQFNGYVSYSHLKDSDRQALKTTLASLSEDLSLLRGKLGIS